VDALPRSRRFPLEAPEELGEFDLIVVGSDEVWNVRHPWYARRPAFFGEGLPARRIVSYAASFGNHDVEDGLCSPWSDMLRRFDLLSVRDRNSHELVRRAVDRDAAVVLDPCLQFPPETETAQAADGGRQLYIAVYGHSFPAWFTAAIRAFAARVGKPLLSIGYRNDWADEQRIDAGPEEFRRLIARAAAVATNFFHGAVFSLLGNRPFACVASAYRANKLRDLTNLLEIEERLVEDDNAAQAMLGTPLERRVASRIGELREQSDRYLVSALA
jgi:polysaccharide pyruvyl transferase WcaK-like protein